MPIYLPFVDLIHYQLHTIIEVTKLLYMFLTRWGFNVFYANILYIIIVIIQNQESNVCMDRDVYLLIPF